MASDASTLAASAWRERAAPRPRLLMLTEYVIDTRLDGPNLTGKLERHAAHDRVYALGNPAYSQIIAWPVERIKKNTRLAG